MRIPLAISLALVALTSAPAWAGDARVEKPIRQMEQGFNTGNVALARNAHVAMPMIVDETTPFAWSGKGSFDHWLADLMRNEKAEGKTDGVVGLGQPLIEKVHGGRAYVVMPSTYTFKHNGKSIRETGTMTFVLVSTRAGWKISAWTWSSPEGVPVG